VENRTAPDPDPPWRQQPWRDAVTSPSPDQWCDGTPLPQFKVGLNCPDLGAYRSGNTGVEGFWRFHGPTPGPHALITSLVHGNEFAGAIVVRDLLARQFRPRLGTLTLGFCNLEAFDRFDEHNPTVSRFVDEDLNRVWDEALLEGGARSSELDRARAMRPLVDQAELVLDLHSMLWPSEALWLSGPAERGAALAARVGTPGLVIADHGHEAGRRLIDYSPFREEGSKKTAVLVEAGQHWQLATLHQMAETVEGFLAAIGMAAPREGSLAAPRMAQVSQAITAQTNGFAFVRNFHGGEVIAQAGTLIARDGTREIRTPYDECLLVMPSLKPSRGHTAVRLAQFAEYPPK